MKKTILLSLLITLLCNINMQAQTSNPPAFVKEFVDKWSNLKNVRFDEEVYSKSMFSEDTTRTFYSSEMFFDSLGHVIAYKEDYKADDSEFVELFDGTYNYTLYDNNTYASRQDTEWVGRLSGNLFGERTIIHELKNTLEDRPQEIIVLPDTLIDGFDCHYIKIITFDSTTVKDHLYQHVYLAFDKDDLFPKYSKTIAVGEATRDGMLVGTIDIFGTTVYTGVVKDGTPFIASNFVPPSNYRLAEQTKKELLGKGVQNPVWSASALGGNTYNATSFKGRTTLLFLTVIDCPANQLSLQMMNNLQARFTTDELQIIAVYRDKEERLAKYVKSNNVRFAAIANGEQIKALYNASGSPFYYLIDKTGIIYDSSNGYNEEVEDKLAEMIVEMNK